MHTTGTKKQEKRLKEIQIRMKVAGQREFKRLVRERDFIWEEIEAKDYSSKAVELSEKGIHPDDFNDHNEGIINS